MMENSLQASREPLTGTSIVPPLGPACPNSIERPLTRGANYILADFGKMVEGLLDIEMLSRPAERRVSKSTSMILVAQ